MLIFLKDTSQRGSDIRRFGSASVILLSVMKAAVVLPKHLISDPLWLVSFRNISTK